VSKSSADGALEVTYESHKTQRRHVAKFDLGSIAANASAASKYAWQHNAKVVGSRQAPACACDVHSSFGDCGHVYEAEPSSSSDLNRLPSNDGSK
jgi:hypothetical protein